MNERRKNFIDSVDWISVINENCSFDELCEFITKNTNINFSTRYMFNHDYIVISKDSYQEFFDYYEDYLKDYCRFTRLDLKYDYREPYNEMRERFLEFWDWNTGVSDKEGLATIYFNSRQSDLFCRFYNKQKEAKLDYPLSRLEYEIKGAIIRQFSVRYRHRGLDDALNYIYSLMTEFNYNRGLTCIVPTFEYEQPLPNFDIVHKEKIEKFRTFLKQYRYSILDYVGLLRDKNELFDLCIDMSDFDKVVS